MQRKFTLLKGKWTNLHYGKSECKNVISVPNGANDNDDVWENAASIISAVKKFYIATDCDEKGQEFERKNRSAFRSLEVLQNSFQKQRRKWRFD